MSAPAGWYDAGEPGRQRWWDGVQWSEHVRDAAAAAPVAAAPYAQSAPMGWYLVPGTADVRWWDGTVWTPYRIRDGKPKPDALAIEPPSTGLVLGILFLAVALLQLVSAIVSRNSGIYATPVLFLVAGGIWIAGSIHTSRVRALPAPRSAPIFDPSARPLPGEVEGPDAGWYPMSRQVTRWWTGAQWSWYIGMKFGPRPGHAGPRGYWVSMVLGWVLVGIAALGLIVCVIGALGAGYLTGFLIGIGLVFAVVFGGLAVFVLLLTRSRRNAMLLPLTPPPVR